MKNSVLKSITAAGMLFFVLLLSSCEHFFTQIHVSNLSADTKELTSTGVLVEKGKSKCTFTLSHESERSITSTPLAADSYNFYFTCLDDADLSFDEAKAVSASYDFILATGMDYELSVIGYSGTNIISELETVCTFSVNDDGIVEDLPVLTMRYASGAHGAFEVTYNWDSAFPSGYVYDSMQVRLLTMNLTDTGLTIVSGPIVSADFVTTGVNIHAENIPIGKYILDFKIKAKDPSNTLVTILAYKEFVHIKPYSTALSTKADAYGIVQFTPSFFTITPENIAITNLYIAYNGVKAVFLWEDNSETAPMCSLQYDNGVTWTDKAGTIVESGTKRAVIVYDYDNAITYRLYASSGSDTADFEFENKLTPESLTYGGTTKNTFSGRHIFEQSVPNIITTIYSTWLGPYDPLLYYKINSGLETLLPPVSTGTITFTQNDPAVYTFYAGFSGAFLELYSVHIMPQNECYVSAAGALDASGTQANPLGIDACINNVEYIQKNGTASYTIKIMDDIILSSLLLLDMDNLPATTVESSDPLVKRTLSTTANDSIIKIIGTTSPKKLTVNNISFSGGKGTIIDGKQCGGAVASLSSGTVSFENCSFSARRVTNGGMGGALYISKGDVTLDSCIIGKDITDFSSFTPPQLNTASNTAVYGGAFALEPAEGDTVTLTLKETIVGNNYGSQGGAFFITGDGTNTVTIDEYSKIYGNYTSNNGGAIETAGSGVVNLTVEGYIGYNTAKNGSAVYIGGNNGSTTFTSTSIIEKNNCIDPDPADKAAVYFSPNATTETKLILKGLISENTFANAANSYDVYVCNKNKSYFYTGEAFKLSGSDGTSPGIIRLGDNVIHKDGDYTSTGILASIVPETYLAGTQVLSVPSDQARFSVVPDGTSQWYIDNNGQLQKTNAIVSNSNELANAITSAPNDGTEYVIVLQGDIDINTITMGADQNIKLIASQDITITASVPGSEFIIVNNGSTFTLGDSYHTITIKGNGINDKGLFIYGDCILNNVIIQDFKITEGNNAAPLYVKGSVTMNGGKIINNWNYLPGGGVYVTNGGTFPVEDEVYVTANNTTNVTRE